MILEIKTVIREKSDNAELFFLFFEKFKFNLKITERRNNG